MIGLAPVVQPRLRAHRVAARYALAPLLACALCDALATLGLLQGAPLARPFEGIVIAIAHALAVSSVLGLERLPASRRWLAAAAVLTVPFAGTVLAAASALAQGRGTSARRRRRRRPSRPASLSIEEAIGLGRGLSPCDALAGGDDEQQRAALVTLSRRGDADSIALLRRVASSPDADLALSAALSLDEIGQRFEGRRGRRDAPSVRHASG